MIQAEQIAGVAKEPPQNVTTSCCLGYIILFFSVLDLIQASATVVLTYCKGENPNEKLIRIVRILHVVNSLIIPFAFFFLSRELFQLKSPLRGCETCRCRCRCAFLPISLAVIASMCFVLQGLNFMYEYDDHDLQVLYVGFASNLMIACLSFYWIITLHMKGQPFCI